MPVNFSNQLKFLCRDNLSFVSLILCASCSKGKKKISKAIETEAKLHPHVIVFLFQSSLCTNPSVIKILLNALKDGKTVTCAANNAAGALLIFVIVTK